MIPDGPASPTARMLMLDEAASWFRRMGNPAAEVASRRAIGRIKRRETKLDRALRPAAEGEAGAQGDTIRPRGGRDGQNPSGGLPSPELQSELQPRAHANLGSYPA